LKHTIDISVVLPIYKSEETIDKIHEMLVAVFMQEALSYEIIFINDASPDNSQKKIDALVKIDPHCKSLILDKNIGQHRAVLNGLDIAMGQIAVVMDANLQDSPSFIPKLINKIYEGYSAVFAGKCGKYQSRSRLVTSKMFKYLLHKLCHIPKDADMFFAIDKHMVKRLKTLKMTSPFVVAMIGLTRLRVCSIPFKRNKRSVGTSAYTAKMRLKIGLTTVLQVICFKLSKLVELKTM